MPYMEMKTKQRRIYKTITAYLSFLSLGMATAVLGIVLLDLQQQTCSSAAQINSLFLWRGCGAIAGCLCTFILFTKEIKQEIILCLSLVTLGMGMISVPLFHSYLPMAFCFLVVGIATGILGVGLNNYIVQIWLIKAAPFIQGLHFAISMGATASPLLASSLLMQRNDNERQKMIGNNEDIAEDLYNINDTGQYEKRFESRCDNRSYAKEDDLYCIHAFCFSPILMILFCVISFTCVLGSVLFLTVSCMDTGMDSRRKVAKTKYHIVKETHRIMEVVVIGLISVICVLVGSLEHVYGGYIALFSVLHLGVSKSTGAWYATIFWSSFTAGRGLGIVAIKFIPPFIILVFNLSNAIISTSLFLIFFSQSDVGVVVLSIMLGLSCSTMYANILAYTQGYLILCPKYVALFTLCLYTGMMIFPSAVGIKMAASSPLSLMYLLLILVGSALCLLLMLKCLVGRCLKTSRAYVSNE